MRSNEYFDPKNLQFKADEICLILGAARLTGGKHEFMSAILSGAAEGGKRQIASM